MAQTGLLATDENNSRDEHIILTFRTLQQNAGLQQRVNNRFQELDQLNTAEVKNTLETLIDILQAKHENGKTKMKWPQEYVFIGHNSMCSLAPNVKNPRK